MYDRHSLTSQVKSHLNKSTRRPSSQLRTSVLGVALLFLKEIYYDTTRFLDHTSHHDKSWFTTSGSLQRLDYYSHFVYISFQAKFSFILRRPLRLQSRSGLSNCTCQTNRRSAGQSYFTKSETSLDPHRSSRRGFLSSRGHLLRLQPSKQPVLHLTDGRFQSC